MTQILGIVGSMRRNGQTVRLVRKVLDEMSKIDSSLEPVVLHTAGARFAPCRVGCRAYCATHPFRCSIDDDMADVFARMCDAKAIILGVPLYFRAPPAGFHTLIERIQSMAFFQETEGPGDVPSPLAGVPCGFVGVTEYSNPHVMLEYLQDFATLMRMRPVLLDVFPYLGVGAHGNIETDDIFRPLDRSVRLARALVDATHREPC